MYLPTKRPQFDAPMESWTPKLVAQGARGYSYNIVAYGDIFWALHWAEQHFDPDELFGGKAARPVIIAESFEEVGLCLDILHGRVDLDRLGATPASPAGKAGDEEPPPSLQHFTAEAINLYRLNDALRERLSEFLPDSPAVKNSRIRLANLFEPGDGMPVIILSPAPERTCNYRCEYCFNHDHGFTKNERAMDAWSNAVLTAVRRIPRPLHMSMGAAGEPLAMKKWIDTATKVLEYGHVKRLAFVTNLSLDPAKVISNFDASRLGILATLHPTEFKRYEQDLANFLNRVIYLRDRGVSVAVNYVLIPDQLERFASFKEKMNSLDIPMICNVLRGPFRGKMYPESYSPEEFELARSCHSETPFTWKFQSHESNPYGIRCTAGRWGFQLDFDGTVYNCDFARQRLGSIHDDTLMVRTDNCHCTANKCESQVMIGMIEDVARDYRMEGNMHTFRKRAQVGFNVLV
jgi:MoaA/NifB/PqqE/SkfB family radical SAM enzyme